MTEQKLKELEERLASLYTLVQEQGSQLQEYATKGYVHKYIESYFGDLVPAQNNYTENSLIAGYKPFALDVVLKHVQRGAMTQYNSTDWRFILGSYDKACRLGNVDPYIAVAQMIHETDWLRSWWSARPRRNPAGLGVTGETSRTAPKDKIGWALRDDDVWVRGYSFLSWEIAAKAHIGHMLGYLYIPEALVSDQLQLVALDPRYDAIPEEWRGSVKTLKELDGKWSIEQGYGRRIAVLANVLVRE